MNGFLDVEFTEDAVFTIIREYTLEAGVRNLARRIEQILRKIAVAFVKGKVKRRSKVVVDAGKVREYLGAPLYRDLPLLHRSPGVAPVLAWTPAGGDLLFATVSESPFAKDGVVVTGNVQKVLEESVEVAWLLASKLLDEKYRKRLKHVHVHFSEAATEKDGPSAGVALVLAFLSYAYNKPLPLRMAYSGEITLSGHILRVGGIKAKVCVARRYGFTEIVLPEANKADVEELPASTRQGLKFHFVKSIEDVIKLVKFPCR